MEIQKNDLKRAIKVVSALPFYPTSKNKSTIFFPIEKDNKEITDGQFTLNVKPKGGAAGCLRAGLAIEYTQDKVVKCFLAYADLSYSPLFDLDEYLSLQDTVHLNKNDAEYLRSLNSYLTPNDYILAQFTIEK